MSWHIRNPIVRCGELPSEHFVIISNELARDVLLSNQAFRIAIILRTHADGWEVSAKSLADALGWSRTTVSKAMKELVEARLLAIREIKTARGTRAYDQYYVPISHRFTDAEIADLSIAVTLPLKGAPAVDSGPHSVSASGCAETAHADASDHDNKEHQVEDQSEDELEHKPACWVCGGGVVGAGGLCHDCLPGGERKAFPSSVDDQACWGCERFGLEGCSLHTPGRAIGRVSDPSTSLGDFAASVSARSQMDL